MVPYSVFLKERTLKTFKRPFVWSGLRGSNSLPPPWQGGALPDELNPQIKWCLRSESNQWHGDFQSPALPTELQRQKWRPGWGSNPRPLAWQASVLTNWTTRPKWWGQQGSNLWPSACKADALPAELCSHDDRAGLPMATHRRQAIYYHNTFTLSSKIFNFFIFFLKYFLSRL